MAALFSPLHLLIVILVALITFGIPLLIVYLLGRSLDKRLQNRPGLRVSVIGVAIGGITDVASSILLGISVGIYAAGKSQTVKSFTRGATMKPSAWFFAILIFSAVSGHAAGCPPKSDFRSDQKGGILVEDVVITGTTTLDSNEIAGISGNFAGSCFDENADDLEERVKSQFQNRGFFTSKVSGLRIKILDPLGSPKPVSIEVEVQEGMRYRLSALRFTDNRSFSSSQLRAVFPMHIRDQVERDKIASGLESLRQLYQTNGYMDMVSFPATTFGSNATVALIVDIDDGKQYHMGKLGIIGKKETAEALQAQWTLPEGAVFDKTYVGKFVADNQAMLGENFDPFIGLQVVRNCSDSTVDVRILLPDSQEAMSGLAAKEIDCDRQTEEPRK